MALPGRDKTFAFENCRDMLMKLEREIERYKTALFVDKVEALQDAAFNTSVTAWHLCDWVFNDLTPDQRQSLKIASLGELQKIVRECRALYLCRQAATASKHWEISSHPDPNVTVIVTAQSVPPPTTSHFPIIVARWSVYFVDDNKRLPAEAVFKEALDFWTQFIFRNGVPDRQRLAQTDEA